MPEGAQEPGEIGWYREIILEFEDGKRAHFEIERKPTGTVIPLVKGGPAPWTRLGFEKCPCCPLPGEGGSCPAALSLQTTLDRLRHHTSTEPVTATAIDERGRKQTVTWALQMVGAVLVELAVFSSECPVGRRVKPYLQGLSPFAASDELLSHVLKKILGANAGSVEGAQKAVQEIIEPLRQVFVYLMRRLGGGSEQPHEDAIPNSIVHVDTFTQVLAFRARRLNEQMASELGWKDEPKSPSAKPGLWSRLRDSFGGS
ncbi:MAG: hypothetical protein HY077_00835 [Elusimicrobia bacterium]|nr:hypothetical protein [Elusimicrobiota bacterium]